MPQYDVVVVGGGLAGLAAASQLGDFRVLVLEKTDRLGGRVWTRSRDGIRYEAGALFAYDPKILAFSHRPSQFVSGDAGMALRHAGKTQRCTHARDCLKAAGLSRELTENALHWLGNDSVPVSALKAEPYRMLQAFFTAIHPGPMSEYWISNRSEVFAKIPNGHFEGGNGELVEALRKEVKAEIRFDSEVSRITDDGRKVTVTFSNLGRLLNVTARRVICATDGKVAGKILESPTDASKKFLASLVYHGGVAVSLLLDRDPFPGIGYIVHTDENPHVLFKSAHPQQDMTMLTGYMSLGDTKSHALQSRDSLPEKILPVLKNYGISITAKEIRFADVQVWEKIGQIISQASYAEWNPANLQPTKNVTLAGDYTYVTPAGLFPYGMPAAVLSGYTAARQTRQELQKNP